MVNIAILGAGFIGDIHASIYKKIRNANVIAFYDVVEERAKSLSEKYGSKYYLKEDDIFNNDSIECIDVCTPPYMHAGLSIKAAENKKHLFCEKSIALSLKDAEKVIAAVSKNRIKAMSGHVLRFWPEYIKAKEILDSGELGKPINMSCHRLIVTPDWNPDRWWLDSRKSGGIATEVLIHDLDIMIWMLGEPQSVKAVGNYDKDMGGFYHISAGIDFQDGKIGLAEAGWGFMGSFPFTAILRILCEKGVIEWQLKAGKNIEERPNSPLLVYKEDGSKYTATVIKEDAFMLELKYFIDCVENDKEIKQATFGNAKSALELALAIRKAAEENKIIKL